MVAEAAASTLRSLQFSCTLTEMNLVSEIRKFAAGMKEDDRILQRW